MTKEVRSLVNYLRFLECPKCSHSAHCAGGDECRLTEVADLIERMSAELDAAKHDLHMLQRQCDNGCLLCAHYVDCEKCNLYQSIPIPPDEPLSCMDLELGECRGMKGSPCKGCDFYNHWEWRGLCNENSQ